jgi:hypothetical protein
VRQRGDGLKASRPIFQEREKTDLLRGYCHDPDQTNRVNKTGYDTAIRVKTSPKFTDFASIETIKRSAITHREVKE